MAGIYIHIPFCRKACVYCDFHFSTSFGLYDKTVKAIIKEIQLKSVPNADLVFTTIYFGGGTPSVLTKKDLQLILTTISENYAIDPTAEITLEANPDDLSFSYLKELNALGVNRLSIGVQSFHEDELLFMNRSHTAEQSYECIKAVKDVGFDNVTIDLIFGLPQQSMDHWLFNLNTAIELQIPHLSCYGLTVEKRTALWHMVNIGRVTPLKDEKANEQFLKTMEVLSANSYEHYEISNYAKEGFISRHNSNYWKSSEYIGFGPSAHSFDGSRRAWNISNNAKYVKSLDAGIIPEEVEKLSKKDRYNEYILTSLRTKWGLEPRIIQTIEESYLDTFETNSKELLEKGLIRFEEGKYLLTKKGKCLADHITADLFIV